MAKEITEPNVGVNLYFIPDSCIVCGDKILIEILLRNLINNALQHTTNGYVKVYAELLSQVREFRLLLEEHEDFPLSYFFERCA